MYWEAAKEALNSYKMATKQSEYLIINFLGVIETPDPNQYFLVFGPYHENKAPREIKIYGKNGDQAFSFKAKSPQISQKGVDYVLSIPHSGHHDFTEGKNYTFLRRPDLTLQRIEGALKYMEANGGVLCPLLTKIRSFPEMYYFQREQNVARLNPQQLEAFQACIDERNPLILVKGPPGTGKTCLIQEVVKYICQETKMKILICTETNFAIDNIVNKLNVLKKDQFLKFEANVKNPSPWSLQALVRRKIKLLEDNNQIADFDEIKSNLLKNTQVICSTIGSLSDKLFFLRNSIDILIIDEAGQASEIYCLSPLSFNPKRAIFIGDENQLQPFCNSNQDKRYCKSLFSRLLQDGFPFLQLVIQYRMPPLLSEIISKTFYQGTLRSIIKLTTKNFENEAKKVRFTDCKGPELEVGTSHANPNEAQEVIKILTMISKEPEFIEKSITILTFYSPQQETITALLQKDPQFEEVECSTVDRFQGKESDIIILSTVRTCSLGFIDDPKRINVALSRARKYLFIVGNKNTLLKGLSWERVFELLETDKLFLAAAAEEEEEEKNKLRVRGGELMMQKRTFLELSRSPSPNRFPRTKSLIAEEKYRCYKQKSKEVENGRKRASIRGKRWVLRCQIPSEQPQQINPNLIEYCLKIIGEQCVLIQSIHEYIYYWKDFSDDFYIWVGCHDSFYKAKLIEKIKEQKPQGILGLDVWKLSQGIHLNTFKFKNYIYVNRADLQTQQIYNLPPFQTMNKKSILTKKVATFEKINLNDVKLSEQMGIIKHTGEPNKLSFDGSE